MPHEARGLARVRARKIVAAAVLSAGALAAGCSSTPAPSPGARPAAGVDVGAASGAGAVDGFLRAARATDVRTMGNLFGTPAGPVAARDAESDVEKRMRALACYLTHDSASLVEDVPSVRSGRTVTVELRQRELVRRTRFTAVAGPRGRWFVESFDIDAVSDFCRPS